VVVGVEKVRIFDLSCRICSWRPPCVVKPFTQYWLLRKVSDRVWCVLSVCETVWRNPNMFEICHPTNRLCNCFEMCVWICWRATSNVTSSSSIYSRFVPSNALIILFPFSQIIWIYETKFSTHVSLLARSLRSPCVNKCGLDEEQLASHVGSQSTLFPSWCQWSSSESDMSSIKVRFLGGFGTGYSSLCGTGLIADGKSGYFTVCLDLEVMPLMLVKQK